MSDRLYSLPLDLEVLGKKTLKARDPIFIPRSAPPRLSLHMEITLSAYQETSSPFSRLSEDIFDLSSKDVEEAFLENGGFEVSNTVLNSNDGFAASTSVNRKPIERCGKAVG